MSFVTLRPIERTDGVDGRKMKKPGGTLTRLFPAVRTAGTKLKTLDVEDQLGTGATEPDFRHRHLAVAVGITDRGLGEFLRAVFDFHSSLNGLLAGLDHGFIAIQFNLVIT